MMLRAPSSPTRPVANDRTHHAGPPSDFKLLGVRINNLTMTEAISRIVASARGFIPASFAFVNADCLNTACQNQRYRKVLAAQNAVFSDGSGIRLASRLRGIEVRGNVNGTDMLPLLCEAATSNGLSVFLLGGQPGIADTAASNLAEAYPDLSIAGSHHGHFGKESEDAVIEAINLFKPDIVLVGMGAPMQEQWIAANRHRINAKVAIGVGGLFDFFSGRIARAPLLLRSLGLEWTWRLAQEPSRMWRRYLLGNPLFLYRCIREQLQDISQSAADQLAERPLPGGDVATINH